jgi:hypothetical protein
MQDRGTNAFAALIGVGIALTAAAALVVTWLPQQQHHAGTATAQPADAAASIAVPRIPYGPAEASRTPAPAVPVYLTGGASGAAVYAAAGTPAVAQAWLTSAGVPSAPAASRAAALTHPFVVWTGPIAPADAAPLQQFAQAGGVLVIDGSSPAAQPLAGVSEPVAATRDRLATLAGGGVPAETLGFPAGRTVGWHRDAGALARFADGTAAIAVRRVGTGLVVLLGAPLAQLVAAPAAGAAPPADLPVGDLHARDTLALVARTLYTLTPAGVTLGSAPQGRAAALVLAHVVADPRGLDSMGPIAAIERDRGTRATFLVVTRTAGSGGTPELTGPQAATLQALAKGGFDVAAAGVAPETIASAPVGSGAEAYPGYAPSPTRGGTTLFGEARVAQHIVGALVRRAPTVFGPPKLVAPTGVGDHLEDALAASGYAADLAVAASTVGGTLPYRATATGATGTERLLLRIPVGFDDAGPVRVDQRGGELDALLGHAVTTGAPATVRISPSGGTAATFALQRLLAGVSPDMWTGDATTFARFWSARYGLTLDVEPGEDAFVVRLAGKGAVPPQTLQLPFRAARAVVSGTNAALVLAGDGRRVLVPAFRDRIEIQIQAAAS